MAMGSASACAALRGGPGEVASPPGTDRPAAAAARETRCDEERYRELRARGPQGLSRQDSLFVVRMSVACTYRTTRALDTLAAFTVDSPAPADTAPAAQVERAPADRGERVTAWTITGLMLWVLSHATGIL